MYISKRKKSQTAEAAGDAEALGIIKDTAELVGEEPSVLQENPKEEADDGGLRLERELYLNGEEERKDNIIAVPDDPQDLDEDIERDMSYAEFLSGNTDTGLLRVTANAGSVSIPLSNVLVTVYKDLSDGRHIFYRVATNADGSTPELPLPAPPRVNSVDGNGAPPYASYTVEAERQGLRGETVENVPVFSGVVSVQPVTLVNTSGEV